MPSTAEVMSRTKATPTLGKFTTAKEIENYCERPATGGVVSQQNTAKFHKNDKPTLNIEIEATFVDIFEKNDFGRWYATIAPENEMDFGKLNVTYDQLINRSGECQHRGYKPSDKTLRVGLARNGASIHTSTTTRFLQGPDDANSILMYVPGAKFKLVLEARGWTMTNAEGETYTGVSFTIKRITAE